MGPRVLRVLSQLLFSLAWGIDKEAEAS